MRLTSLQLLLFPNPAINEIRVNIPANMENKAGVTYSIYHINGTSC